MTLTRALLMPMLLMVGACGRRSGGAPAIEPAPRPVVAADVPAVVDAPAAVDVPAADAPAAVDAPPAQSEAAAANERLLRGLADGTIPMATGVDPARGVVMVTYLEAGPNGGRERHASQRLCGAAVARGDVVRRRLQALVAQSREMDEPPACDDNGCVARGMEYQPALRARFALRADGTRVLVGAMEISETLLGDEWLERTAAYATAALERARTTPCPR